MLLELTNKLISVQEYGKNIQNKSFVDSVNKELEVKVKMDNSINNDRRNKFYMSSKYTETEYFGIDKEILNNQEIYNVYRSENPLFV